jgi:hypothetical protein
MKENKWKNDIFEMSAKFLHVGMKEQWDKSVGRIVPHDITGGGAIMLEWMCSSVLKFGFQLNPPVNMYTFDHMFTWYAFAQNLICSGSSGI